MTRHASSAQVQEWAHCGAEVVQADLDDAGQPPPRYTRCLWGILRHLFLKYFSPEKELAEACTLAEATKSEGVWHVIWSTLEDSRQWVPLFNNRMSTVMRKYKVSCLDAMGEVNHCFTDLGVPTTFLFTTFYWENFIHQDLRS